MSLWEKVGESYLDAAKGALPLPRAIVFTAAIVISVTWQDNKFRSIVEGLAHINLGETLNKKSAILDSVTLGHVAFGALAVLVGWLVSQALFHLTFRIAAHGIYYDNRVKALLASRDTSNLTLKERSESIAFIDSLIKEYSGRLKRDRGLAELAAGLGVTFLIASFVGGFLDVCVGGLLFPACIALHIRAIRMFFRDLLGPTLMRSLLLGRAAPKTPDAI